MAALAAPVAEADPANFVGASADGGRVFFTTTEKLVPGDTDNRRDVYERFYDSEPGIASYVTREVSTGPIGGNDAYDANYDGASEDGTKVFFSSDESLVPEDTDRSADVYMRDLASSETKLVSTGAAVCQPSCGNGSSGAIFVGASPNGSKVFFATDERLAPGDTDNSFDIYMRNVESGEATLVSQGAASCAPACGNGPFSASFNAASADGSIVVFSTDESLVGEDEDELQDVYVRTLSTGITRLVSTVGVCPAGLDCNAVYRGASEDGSHVFFQTDEQISPSDEDESSDVYAWVSGSVSLVSTGPAGGNGTPPATFAGSSANGTKVFFQTSESLTPEDEDAATDIYMRDLLADTTTLVSRGASTCTPSGCGNGPADSVFRAASANGTKVFFQTSESLTPEDEDAATDVYMRDLTEGTTTLVSQGEAACVASGCGNGPGDARLAGLTPDGARVLFSTAESLGAADGNQSSDVYMRELTGESPATTLESPTGICPLPEEKGCHASFDGASEDGSHVFFSTVGRLTAEDVDSEQDVYERAEGRTRLVSAGNSLQLGPATPILTGTNPSSPNPSTEPAIVGQADVGTSIKVYATADCSGAPVATGTSTGLASPGIRAVVAPESTTTFRATATDSHGDTSACSAAGVTYRQVAESDGGGEEGGGGGGTVEGGGDGGTGGPATGGAQSGARGGISAGGAHPVAPQTRITFGPAFKTRLRRPTFQFVDGTGQERTSFLCEIDRHGWQRCGSPQRLSKLRNGSHVFRVKGVNSGIWESQPVSRRFKVVSR